MNHETITKYFPEIPNSWVTQVDKLITEIEAILDKYELDRKILWIAQVKEKFGHLRFYYSLQLFDDICLNEKNTSENITKAEAEIETLVQKYEKELVI